MAAYERPSVTHVGSLHELTQTVIPKYGSATGDVIIYQGNSYPVPGSTTS